MAHITVSTSLSQDGELESHQKERKQKQLSNLHWAEEKRIFNFDNNLPLIHPLKSIFFHWKISNKIT